MSGAREKKTLECVQNVNPPTGTKRKCCVEGCNRPSRKVGMCAKHYNQIRKHGSLLERTRHSPNTFWFDKDFCYVQIYDMSCKPKCVVTIDTEDYERVKKYKWNSNNKKEVCNRQVGSLSRFITNTTDSNLNVDHKNHDRLDNRKINLRVCSGTQNNANARIPKNNSSGYKGVSLHKLSGQWMSRIRVERKLIHLGYFDTKEEAARAYNHAARRLFGEFAFLNSFKKKNKIGFIFMKKKKETAVKKKRKARENKPVACCGYCIKFQLSKNITENGLKLRRCKTLGKDVSAVDAACKDFYIDDYFWCSKEGQRISILVCQKRRGRKACSRNCSQGKKIDKIQDEMKPPFKRIVVHDYPIVERKEK